MNLMYLLAIFSYLLLQNRGFVSSECLETMKFANCEGGRKAIYRGENLRIVAEFKRCQKGKYIFDYELKPRGNGKNRAFHNNDGPILYVNKYTLDPGLYEVNLRIHSENDKFSISMKHCIINVMLVPLYAEIDGGFERYATKNKGVVLKTSYSMDFSNENPSEVKNFKYSWTYSCRSGECSIKNFDDRASSMSLSGQKLNNNERYIFRLGLKSKWHKQQVFTYQIVNVEDFTQFHIDCTGYCPPFDMLEEVGEFEVKCTFKCPNSTKMWNWNLYKAPNREEDLLRASIQTLTLITSLKNCTKKCQIDPAMLETNEAYLLTVALANFPNKAASYRIFSLPLYNLECSITPESGVILETEFHFDCEGDSKDTYFSVSLKTDDGDQLIQYDNSWKDLKFTLPESGMVSLISRHYSGGQQEFTWDPALGEIRLSQRPVDAKELKELLSDGEESIDEMISNQNYHRAIDKLTLVSSSLAEIIRDPKQLQSTTTKIVSNLAKIPATNIASVQKLSKIMERLIELPINFTSTSAKQISNFCRELAEKNLNASSREFIKSKGHKTNSSHPTIKKLMKCSDVANRPNDEAIEPVDLPFNITTIETLVDDGNYNTENYDEYFNDVRALSNKDKYKEITTDGINLCLTNAKLLSRDNNTMKLEDLKFGEYFLSVLKGPSGIFNQPIIKMPEIEIALIDRNFHEYPRSIFIFTVCSTSKNIFWWDKSRKISTGVAFIHLERQTLEHVVVKFDSKTILTFNILHWPMIKFKPSIATLKLYNLSTIEIRPEREDMLIYVVKLDSRSTFCIEFLDLGDITLEVFTTDFTVPNIVNGNSMTTINSKNNSYGDNSLTYRYPIYKFISVKIKNKEIMQSPVTFSLRLYEVSCVEWSENDNTWIQGCYARFQPFTNSVDCICTNFSAIASSIKQIEVRRWDPAILLDIELPLQYYYNISTFMLLIFLIYCMLLCFRLTKVHYWQKTAYFLSDISYTNRYGYLVVITTSSKIGSGTTSNVVINIVGENGSSEPHVLNYPDPFMKFLQKGNEDWFFLATNTYLGHIHDIELWFDGIGALPSWSCNEIQLYDFQRDRWYKFAVFDSFTVYPKTKAYIKTTAISYEDVTKKSRYKNLLHYLMRWNICGFGLRQSHENMTYVKRLTVLLSCVSLMAFGCLVYTGIPEKMVRDSIEREFEIDIASVLIVISISFVVGVIHLTVIKFFWKSQVQFSHVPKTQINKWPLLVTFNCWIFLIINIIGTNTVIIIYGVWIPPLDSYMWATHVVIGMLFYIFVMENIFSLVHKLKTKNEMKVYITYMGSKLIGHAETQRRILYKAFGKHLLRPYLKHLYSPIKALDLKVQWYREKINCDIRELLENLLMFVLFVSILYQIVLQTRSSEAIYSNTHIYNLVKGATVKTGKLEEVISPSTLEQYIEDVLIEATQSQQWYGEYAVKDPGMTKDYKNKILGVIRFRQHRSVASSCSVHPLMKFVNRTCNDNYFNSQTKKNFGLRWMTEAPPPSEDRNRKVWEYTHSDATGTTPILGKMGYYPGGGYVAYLGRNMKNSRVNLYYLKNYEWINDPTRSIFIEFILYNANSNIFNAVRIMIEKSVSGYLKIEEHVETTTMLQVNRQSLSILNILIATFIILVLIFFAKSLIRFIKDGVWYLKDMWHFVDLIIISLSLSCIILFYHREHAVERLLKSLEGKEPKDFPNYFSVLRWDNTFNVILSILITIASIKLWGLFRFMRIFKIAEKTMIISIPPMGALMLYHGIILAAFALVGFIFFVRQSYLFAGFANIFEFLLVLNLRSFTEEEVKIVHEKPNGLGYVFFVTYSIAVEFFKCVYIALIVVSYSRALTYYSGTSEVYTVKEYLNDRFAFYYNFLKMRFGRLRLVGGEDKHEEPHAIYPKPDEYYFADSFSIKSNKIKAMALISLGVLKKLKHKKDRLTNKDLRLMTYILYYLEDSKREIEDDEYEIFYKGDLGGNVYKLVHESQIKRVATIATILLGGKQDEFHMKKNTNKALMHNNAVTLQRIRKHLSLLLRIVDKISVQ